MASFDHPRGNELATDLKRFHVGVVWLLWCTFTVIHSMNKPHFAAERTHNARAHRPDCIDIDDDGNDDFDDLAFYSSAARA